MKQPTPFLLTLALGTTALIAHAAPASADDRVAAATEAPTIAPLVVTNPAPAERQNSINANPIGFVLGFNGLSYEHLSGSHGLLVEGAFRRSGDVTAYGGSVGYRWHWRGRQNSGFLGANVGLHGGSNGVIIYGTDMPLHHELDITSLELVVNIGKRWQFDNGLNITARIGGGAAKLWVTTTYTDAESQQDAAEAQDSPQLALDGELSLGYSF